MMIHIRNKTLVLRTNAERLRGVFWISALGMGMLLMRLSRTAERDIGKIIGGAMGILLFGFSGFVLQTRHIVIDILRRDAMLVSKRVRGTTTTRFRLENIVKIFLVTIFGSVEDGRRANFMRKRSGSWWRSS